MPVTYSTDDFDLDQLIEAAYWSASTGNWDAFLDIYAEKFPHSKSTLCIFDSARPDVDVVAARNYDPEAILQYGKYYGALNPWSSMASSNMGWPVQWGHESVSLDALHKTEFYNDWIRPQEDAYQGFGIAVARSRSRTFAISNNFNPRYMEAGERQFKLAQRLQPHLRRAYTLQLHLEGRRLFPVELAAVLGGLSHAVYVVDASATLHFANTAADGLIRTGAVVRRVASRKLIFSHLADQAGFERSLGELATNRKISGPPLQPLSVTLSRYALLITPLVDQPPSAQMRIWLGAARPQLFMVMIIDLLGEGRSTIEIVRGALGLTPAEARLALGLVSGHSLREYADAQGVSYETARSTMRAVLSKTGAKAQADLMRRLTRIVDASGWLQQRGAANRQ